MSRPILNVTYTVPVIPPNAAPLASFTYSCTSLDCDFTDTSVDNDGTIVSWDWDFAGSGNSVAQNSSYSFATDGTYTVQLTVTDNEGATDAVSRQVTVSVPPLFTDVVANAELPGAGTVSGTYLATQVDDGTLQSIRERESGGKKQNRFSYLIHTWQASLPVNAMATVYVNAWSGGSIDDSFVFSWSTDNDTYSELFTVLSTDPGNQRSAVLPQGVSGTIYIKVEDTDQLRTNRSLDTVFVDHLYIRAESGAGAGAPPAAPSALIATAAGSSQVDLVWADNAADEAGFKIERSLDNVNYSQIAATGTDITSYSDNSVSDSTTYLYRVSAWNASGDSGFSNTSFATTGAGINLTLNGYKTRGKHTIELTWNGATTLDVDIIRDDALLETVPNSDFYLDATSSKGGRTYQYQLCEENGGNCSAVEFVTF